MWKLDVTGKEKDGAEKTKEEKDKYHFYVSDLAERLTDFATSILPAEVKETKQINIEEF